MTVEIYAEIDASVPLSQGDILEGCRILAWKEDESVEGGWRAVESIERVLILAQACDVASPKIKQILVGVVHSAHKLVADQVLTGQTVRDQIRKHRQYGWYFLPKSRSFPESIVDLRDVFAAPRQMLEQLARDGHRLCRLITPYREHLAQHFAVTYSRIGLPQPYETE